MRSRARHRGPSAVNTPGGDGRQEVPRTILEYTAWKHDDTLECNTPASQARPTNPTRQRGGWPRTLAGASGWYRAHPRGCLPPARSNPMSTIVTIPPSAPPGGPPWTPALVPLPVDHRIVFRGVSWETYESLDQAQGEGVHVRLAYDGRDLEIMTTGYIHEVIK